MTKMSKVKKSDLFRLIKEQALAISHLSGMVEMNKLAIIKLENELEQSKLKTLDQSVFDGLDEKWQFAAVDKSGEAWIYTGKPVRESVYWHVLNYVMDHIASSAGTGYDTTDWKNSLIERESKELTGSDLCRAMLERGDKYVMCFVSGMSDARADSIPKAITSFNLLTGQFRANHDRWQYAIPINNQGEPLTAADVGL